MLHTVLCDDSWFVQTQIHKWRHSQELSISFHPQTHSQVCPSKHCSINRSGPALWQKPSTSAWAVASCKNQPVMVKNIDLNCGTAAVSWLLALVQSCRYCTLWPRNPPKHCLKPKQSVFFPMSLPGNCCFISFSFASCISSDLQSVLRAKRRVWSSRLKMKKSLFSFLRHRQWNTRFRKMKSIKYWTIFTQFEWCENSPSLDV